jgi:hypothetical protein
MYACHNNIKIKIENTYDTHVSTQISIHTQCKNILHHTTNVINSSFNAVNKRESNEGKLGKNYNKFSN